MLKIFIEKPVVSTVISILIVILGFLGLKSLPLEEYPDIAPATIKVTANYPGANAETVLESVITPLEEQINGVEGMTYITSTATTNGTAEITVYFDQKTNPDIAAVNVQNRVDRASSLLPQEVKQIGVITQKQQNSALMYISVYSTNKKYGEVFINNYLKINVIPELQRIKGVGDVTVFKPHDYAIRVWLDPQQMASYNLVPSDITKALNEQSLEGSAGTLGQNNGEEFSYVIKYDGRFKTVGQYESIIIKAIGKGQYLRLKDIARVEFGAQAYTASSNTEGNPDALMAIFQTKGSNAHEIIEQIHTKLDDFQAKFPPGLKIFIPFDSNDFLNASVDKVKHTLIEAFILVFIVVFVFLQDFKSTLVPAIAVPVSIIGTFFFLNLLGYSVNMLTLFAIVLAIGIVVDDAIVVVEAVHHKMEHGEKNPLKATIDAMKGITAPIVSITLVMVAAFVPVTFIEGPTGVFYKQFGITLVIAILISAVNALTLSPALSALFLRFRTRDQKRSKSVQNKVFRKFNIGFDKLVKRYGVTLYFLARNKWITVVFLILTFAGIYWSATTTPTGFVPTEDRKLIFSHIETPPGTSLERTNAIAQELYLKAKGIPGIDVVGAVSGLSLLYGQGSNYGAGFFKLKQWDERKADSLSLGAITAKLQAVAATIKGANIIFFPPPNVPGYGNSAGFEVNLIDKSAGSFTVLDTVNQAFMKALRSHPEVQYVQTSFNSRYPQYKLDINVPEAKEHGVAISEILSTLQGYIGSIYAADFTRFGKQYRVYIQAGSESRAREEDLNKMYVRTAEGKMAPITEFVTLKRVFGPQSVTRFNLYNSAILSGGINPGYSSGDAIKVIEEEAKKLPNNFAIDYSGITREEVIGGNQTTFIFILSIVFVYFLLAAQYSSYILPFSILFSLPVGVFGAYITTKIMGLENNIYFQIALLMLVGLLAKNAILIVEFALQRRNHGIPIIEAAIQGAKIRLRPIIMTSFAFILGMAPLAVAQGVGASGNRAIGTGAIGGLLIGTVLGVFVIPVLFIVFQQLQELIKKPSITAITSKRTDHEL